MLSPSRPDCFTSGETGSSPDFTLLAQFSTTGRVLRLTPRGYRLIDEKARRAQSGPAMDESGSCVPAEFVAAALAEGYIEPDVTGEAYRLTAHGRTTLRRRKSQAAAAAAQTLPHLAGSPCDPQSARPETPGFNASESPLAWLRRRVDRDGKPMINEAQFEAGERLRSDLWLAGLTPRITQTWSDTPSSRRTARATPGGSAAMTDTLVAARQRVNRAMDAVGPEFGNLLIDVCGFLIGLEAIEASQSWPQRSAKLMLQTALTALGRHYGLLPPVDGDKLLRNRLRHWGADDYRPTLDRWT